MSGYTLVNGCFTDVLSIDDRGLAYGDGLFDTLLVVDGQPRFYQRHCQRLQRDCARLGLSVCMASLANDLNKLLSVGSLPSRAVLKTVITRGSGERGYGIPKTPSLTRIMSLSPAKNTPKQEALHLTVCDTRLSQSPVLGGIKHLCRLENVLARNEWRTNNIDEGIMLDSSGNVIEGTRSNLFWFKGDVLHTPDIGYCGVAGIVREVIIEQLAPQLGMKVKVGRYKFDELYGADELFVTNSLIGIAPVASIGCYRAFTSERAMQLKRSLEVMDA